MEELAASFHLGAQVWQKENNHDAKKRLFIDAVRRAKIRHNLSKGEDKQLYGTIDQRANP